MTRKDDLYQMGYKAYPEVEDYILQNLNDFIGINLDYITFVFKFAATNINEQFNLELLPEDIQLTILVLLEQDLFKQTGIDGNTKIFSPVKDMWIN